MEFIVSGKILSWISCLIMLYCGLELFQDNVEATKVFIENQTATIKRNKEIILVVILLMGAVVNGWKLYEKILMDKEKRRALRLDNDLKEKELKNENP
jgi:predicted negative regulator of RcsB-dependent stress response